jgi:hypothetical protein
MQVPRSPARNGAGGRHVELNMRQLGLSVAMLAVAVAYSCGAAPEPPSGGSTPPALRSGIQGVALVDEGCPVLQAGSPCPEHPMPARVVVSDQAGAEVTTTDTTDAGQFSIELPEGSYVVRAENKSGTPLPTAKPIPVTVRSEAMTPLTIHFDSGVRGPATR